jgi:hypothetical protein
VRGPGSKVRFDIADIARQHRKALETRYHVNRQQRRVLTAISQCRTAALGGHVEVCEHGDFERIAYNSCRNRHCPKCQALAQERWIATRSERLLDVGHFHGVFTLPSELRPLAQWHPAEVYGALFRAVTDTLLELGRTRLGVTLGLTLILHTWTRELGFHVHLHVLVTAGGLALPLDPGSRMRDPGDGSGFVHTRHGYLFPLEMMGVVFRAKMLHELGLLREKGDFPELTNGAYGALMAPLANKAWIVYAKKPFRRSTQVIEYLGRYTHRVGIANSRIQAVTDETITFATKHGQTVSLHPVEFLRRLVQHVLPPGFHKIRHAGLYGSARPGGLLERAKAFVGAYRRPRKAKARLEQLERAHRTCPVCGGELRRMPLSPACRAPPTATP